MRDDCAIFLMLFTWSASACGCFLWIAQYPSEKRLSMEVTMAIGATLVRC
jgi:hypothetical protein